MRFQPDSLYYGDCLDVMREWPAACVDLCYLDPPFNSKTNYNILFGTDNGAGSTKGSFAQVAAFEDTWAWDDAAQDRVDAITLAVGHPAHRVISGLRAILGDCGMLAYLSYMAERLAEIRRVLKPKGTVYLHCDKTASHYLKLVMDAVFGVANFRSEVHWYYYNKMHDHRKRLFAAATDTLFVYVKDAAAGFTFHQILEKRDQPVTRLARRKQNGRMVNARDENGNLIYQVKTHRAVDNVWRMPCLQPASKEWLPYPTQKPVALLRRILEASSNPEDVVLDPFCGCGATIVAARALNRRFVGIDVSHFAIDIVRRLRLKDSQIPVNGIPVDMYTAKQLAREKPFEFEKWAVTRVPGMVPNQRQIGDRGIDGRGKLLDGGLVLAQVKGGNFALGHLRDFRHVLSRESAACGVFTTLDTVSTRNARVEAQGAGYLEVGASRYPKTQLWSIEEYFQDRFPHLPPLADPYTGKAMQMELY